MVVETDRLVVRPWRLDEAPMVLDIMSRVEVVQWLDDGPPKLMTDLDAARDSIRRRNARSQEPPLGYWAIEVRATGQAIGSVLLLTLPNAEHGEVEIGWHVHPDWWGQGYASEAAAAVLAYGLDRGLPEIYALTHLDNYPSQGVARKIGMEDLGETDRWYEEPSVYFRARAAPSGPP